MSFDHCDFYACLICVDFNLCFSFCREPYAANFLSLGIITNPVCDSGVY